MSATLIIQAKTTHAESIKDKEIIEIGACLLDHGTLLPYEPFSVFIKPKGKISKYCTKVTGISPEDVSSGASLYDAIDAINEIYDLKEDPKPWASFGFLVCDLLNRQCKGGFLPQGDFMNIRLLCSYVFRADNEKLPLKQAIAKLGMNLPKSNDLQDEVLNSALIFAECLKRMRKNGGNQKEIPVMIRRNKK